jgi:hypothetical protein
MTITITDPVLLAQLAAANGLVELTAPDGRILGRFVTENFGKPPPGFQSPFTDEELEEFRKVRTGRPLVDIIRDLEKRAQE